jgi:hypothetical protein
VFAKIQCPQERVRSGLVQLMTWCADEHLALLTPVEMECSLHVFSRLELPGKHSGRRMHPAAHTTTPTFKSFLFACNQRSFGHHPRSLRQIWGYSLSIILILDWVYSGTNIPPYGVPSSQMHTAQIMVRPSLFVPMDGNQSVPSIGRKLTFMLVQKERGPSCDFNRFRDKTKKIFKVFSIRECWIDE